MQRSIFSSWGERFGARRIRAMVPVGFKGEIKELSKLAGPVVRDKYCLSVLRTGYRHTSGANGDSLFVSNNYKWI